MKIGILHRALPLLLSLQLAAQPVLASFSNYSSTVEATRNTLFNLPPVNEFHDLRAASTPTARDFKVLLDVQSPTFSDTLRSAMVDTNGNPLNLGNLGGVYDPFAVPTQTALPYAKALETRFPYTDYGTFLSSGFMMSRLKYSPEHEPRMGNDEWAGLRLLGNVAANLRPTDTTGQGQAANTRKGSTQLSGNNVKVYASGNISVTGGNTQAKQNLTLSADGNLDTQAAALGAGNHLVAVAGNNLTLTTSSARSGGNTTLAAGNDLKLASATQTDSGTRGDIKWTNSREVGNSISSGGNLTLVAGNDIGVRASTATAEGQLTASAGNDLTVEAGENYQSHEYHRSETKKKWYGKKTTTTTDHFEEHLTHTASTLQGKGGVSLEAGNDTTVIGSRLQSGGNLEVTTGGQLAILAAEDKHIVQHDQQTKKSFLGINYGKSTSSSTSTQTRAAGSASEAMGDMATTSGGSSTFQASKLQAGGTLNIKAGGGVNIVSGTNTDSLDSQSSSTSFGGALSRNSTDTVQQSTVASSTLSAKQVNIDAQSIILEASTIEAQAVSLIADSVALISGKNSLYENHTSDDSGILLREIETQGQIKQDAVAATITAATLTLNGRQLADASLSTDALLKQVSSEGQLTDAQLTTLKAQLENQSWHEQQTTLSKMGSLIVQAVATYLAPGVGSSFGQSLGQVGQVMVQRAVNHLSQQVTQALLTAAITGNKVELDFDELLKGAVKTGVLAGVNAKLDLQFGFSKLDTNGKLVATNLSLDQQLVQASLHAATQTAIQGGNFADNLRNGLVDVAGKNLAGYIGDNKDAWGDLGHKAAHAALGCAIVAAKQGDCSAGAIGAVAGEIAAELTGLQTVNATPEQQQRIVLLTSQLSSITAAALAGQEDLSGAMGAATNAVTNNFLTHTQQAELAKQLNACAGDSNPDQCRLAVYESWLDESAANNSELARLFALCKEQNECDAYGEFIDQNIAGGDLQLLLQRYQQEHATEFLGMKLVTNTLPYDVIAAYLYQRDIKNEAVDAYSASGTFYGDRYMSRDAYFNDPVLNALKDVKNQAEILGHLGELAAELGVARYGSVALGSLSKISQIEELKTVPEELINDIATYTGKTTDEVKQMYMSLTKMGISYGDYLEKFAKNNPYGLTTEDVHYIFAYTTNLYYKKLNGELRGKTLTSDAGRRIADKLTSALNKLPDIQGDYYRGLKDLDLTAASSVDDVYGFGEIVTETQFNSLADKIVSDYTKGNSRTFTFTRDTQVKDISDLSINKFADKFGNEPLDKEFIMMPGATNKVIEKDGAHSVCQECDK